MPPKGSGKALDPNFRRNERDPSQVQSIVCTAGIAEERRPWIALRSVANHLQTSSHFRAVKSSTLKAKESEEKLRKQEREREAASATDELREIHFATQRFDGPVASASSRVMGGAGAEMWEDYRVNGAEFSAGDNVENPENQHRRLREEAEIFGLWNPDGTARQLGFGGDDVEGQTEEDDDDDLLAEILRNAGEFCLETLASYRGFHFASETQRMQTSCKEEDEEEVWFGFDHMLALMAELPNQVATN
ncbi:hypothetical protein K438DRAFT_1780080 [Mycena galopus ATCC 62051]|nr:hypothetical protein K438DRAFT_1780080 [Mycena galopus ATCC 62051]